LKLLNSDETKEKYKLFKESFTRSRKLGFRDIALLILGNNKQTLQITMDKHLEAFKPEEKNYNKSSYTKARSKITPSLFAMLNDKLVQEYYKDNEEVILYKNFRVLGVDGSTLQLPNVESIEAKNGSEPKKMSQDIREIYGYCSNDKGDYETKARISILVDVYNNVILEGVLNSYLSSEQDMAFGHIDHLVELKTKSSQPYNDLIIFDRGYPSYALLLYLEKYGIDYVIRMPKSRFKEIDTFRQSDYDDRLIELKLTKTRLHDMKRKNSNPKVAKIIEDKKIDETLKLRAIKVPLDSGEIEILITSLVDTETYKSEIFKELYFKRWGVEEEYKALKTFMQVENFTGITQIAINQDFFATLFMLNMTNRIISDIESEDTQNDNQTKPKKYRYKVNRNYSIGTIKDKFIYLVLTGGDIELFFNQIEEKLKKNMIPIKPNRKFKRKKHSSYKYPISQKKAI